MKEQNFTEILKEEVNLFVNFHAFGVRYWQYHIAYACGWSLLRPFSFSLPHYYLLLYFLPKRTLNKLNPGAPGKMDPLGLHFAHKNVQID